MNNAGTITGASHFNGTSIVAKFQGALTLMHQNAAEVNPTTSPNAINADTFEKLKTILERIAEFERYAEELELSWKKPEQEVKPITNRPPAHSAVAVLEDRRSRSVAPLLMARIPTRDFDFIDPRSITKLSAKEIKRKQEEAALEQKIVKLNKVKALRQEVLDLIQSLTP